MHPLIEIYLWEGEVIAEIYGVLTADEVKEVMMEVQELEDYAEERKSQNLAV